MLAPWVHGKFPPDHLKLSKLCLQGSKADKEQIDSREHLQHCPDRSSPDCSPLFLGKLLLSGHIQKWKLVWDPPVYYFGSMKSWFFFKRHWRLKWFGGKVEISWIMTNQSLFHTELGTERKGTCWGKVLSQCYFFKCTRLSETNVKKSLKVQNCEIIFWTNFDASRGSPQGLAAILQSPICSMMAQPAKQADPKLGIVSHCYSLLWRWRTRLCTCHIAVSFKKVLEFPTNKNFNAFQCWKYGWSV